MVTRLQTCQYFIFMFKFKYNSNWIKFDESRTKGSWSFFVPLVEFIRNKHLYSYTAIINSVENSQSADIRIYTLHIICTLTMLYTDDDGCIAIEMFVSYLFDQWSKEYHDITTWSHRTISECWECLHTVFY